MGVRPTTRCVLLFAAGIGVALVPVFLGERWVVLWVAWVALSGFAAGLDLLLALPRRALSVTVDAPASLFVGASGDVQVTLVAPKGPAAKVAVEADVSGEVLRPAAREVALVPGVPETAAIPLLPRRRGTLLLERVRLRWTGPLGLVERRAAEPVGASVSVVPDVRPVRSAALRFFTSRAYLAGLRTERYVGDGSEFDSLREYQPGLDPRAIDWKATARHRRLLSRDFRAERDRRVVVAFDTGRLMREPLDGLPRLDHAIHAGLLLAYVALRSGDRVGLYAFDERPRAYVEPDTGADAFPRLRAATAALEYSTGETNYTLGLTSLQARLKRRALIVVLTDFVDSVTAELLVDNLSRLRRRHLVVLVALRDPGLEALAAAEPWSLADLHRSVVGGDLLRERDVVMKRLSRLAVRTVDARPSEVSAGLLNRYLDIRRRELVG